MRCGYKVAGKCMGSTKFRKHCGTLRALVCGERRRFNAIIQQKKRLIESRQPEELLGIGA